MKAMPRKARQTRKIARLCSEFVCVTIKLDAEGAQAESKRGRKVKGEWGMGKVERRPQDSQARENDKDDGEGTAKIQLKECNKRIRFPRQVG